MSKQKLIKKIGYVVIPGVLALLGGQALAATANSSAAATIVTPIAITNTQGLSFGDVFAGTAVSTIVLDNAGGRAVGIGDAALGATAGSAAAFDVTGEVSAAYSINLPVAAVTLTSGSDTMTVNSFTTDGTGVLSAGGAETINVGATLNVAASQPSGSYAGTFTVEAIY